MSLPTDPAPNPPWRDLAARALGLAQHDMLDRAVKVVERIEREHTAEVLPDVLLAWIDTTVHRCGFTATAPVGLAFRAVDTGAVTGADDVPPDVAWAGRLFTARINDDRDTFEGLIKAAANDHDWSAGVVAVLYGAALMCNTAAATR